MDRLRKKENHIYQDVTFTSYMYVFNILTNLFHCQCDITLSYYKLYVFN